MVMLESPACEQLQIRVALHVAVSLVISIQRRKRNLWFCSVPCLLSAHMAAHTGHIMEGAEGPPAVCPSLMCFLEILACFESPCSGVWIFLLYLYCLLCVSEPGQFLTLQQAQHHRSYQGPLGATKLQILRTVCRPGHQSLLQHLFITSLI